MGRRTGRKGRKVQRVVKRGPKKVDAPKFRDLAEKFALLGSELRLRILTVLTDGPRSVNFLCEYLNRGQPTVSHHLMLMRWGGLVASVRDGKGVLYHSLPGSLAVLMGTLRLLAGKT